MLKKLIYLFSSLLLSHSVFSQQGKNGAGNIVAANAVVNTYTALTANAAAGATVCTVASVAGINAGDLVMIIQMQGATVKNGGDSTWGAVTAYNSCGFYEFHEVLTVDGGSNSISFSCPLDHFFSSTGRTQVIKVPRYTSLTVQAGATVTAIPWNGSAGGVVVMEVSGNAIVNGSINVTGLGFRPGVTEQNTNYSIAAFASFSSFDGGEKGESIAGFGVDYDAFGGRYGRGAPANGGGGGDAHNAGGGGGANAGMGVYTGNGNPSLSTGNWADAWNKEYAGFANSTSSGGGRGGYTYGEYNVDALTVAPGSNGWGGDNRRNVGGKGGRPLDYSSGRLFFGGGAGAGDSNNGSAGEGGAGGGLVFLNVCGTITGTGSVFANGNAGKDKPVGTGGNDAPSGGGGGGTVVLNADGAVTGITIVANGGKGGIQDIGSDENEGPGGGGGGGYIAITNGNAARSALGGTNGTTNSTAVTEFIPNGATKGGDGISNAVFSKSIFSIGVKDDTICAGQTATLSAGLQGDIPPNATLSWYKTSSRTSFLTSDASFTTEPLFADTVFYVGACPYSCSTALIPVHVRIMVIPVGNAGNDTSVCSGISLKIGKPAKSGYSYVWAANPSLSSLVIAQPMVAIVNTGATPISSTFFLTVSKQGCVANDEIVVTVYPNPAADAGRDTSLCANAIVQLGAASSIGYTYSWSPILRLDNAALAMPKFQQDNSGSTSISSVYTLIVKNTFGCQEIDQVTVVVKPRPVATAGRDTSTCSAMSLQLGATATNGYSYSWSPSVNLDDAAKSNPIFQMTNDGSVPILNTYTVSVTAAGCSSTDQVVITVNPLPKANAGRDTVLCSNASSLLGVPSILGYSYVWSPTIGLVNAIAAQPTFTKENTSTLATVSNYHLVVKYYGCSASDDVQVVVNPIPNAEAGKDSAVCSGVSMNFGVAMIPTYTYSWSPADALDDASKSNPLFQKTNNTNSPWIQNYTLTVTALGCTSTDQVAVTVNPQPKANAGRDTVLCSATGAILGSPAVPGYVYEWTPSSGLNSVNTAQVNFYKTNVSAVGLNTEYTVKVSFAGCSSSDKVSVLVNPYPIPNAGRDTVVCAFSPIRIGALALPGYTYVWHDATFLEDVNTADPKFVGVNTSNVTTTFEYTVLVSYLGCVDSDKVRVKVKPLPKPDAGRDTVVCPNAPLTIGAAAVSGYTYLWSPASGLNSVVKSNANTVSLNNGDVDITSTYFLNVTWNGCSAIDEVKILIHPFPFAYAGKDTAVCPNDVATIGTEARLGHTYLWAPVDHLNNAALAQPTFQRVNSSLVALENNYTLTVEAKGCKSTSAVKLQVNPNPIADAGPDTVVCSGKGLLFANNSTLGAQYQWMPSDFLSASNDRTPYFIASKQNEQKDFKYRIRVTLLGCIFEDEVNIALKPNPIADAGPDVNVCAKLSQNIGSKGTSIFTYSWYPAINLDDPSSSNPLLIVKNNGVSVKEIDYYLTVSNGACTSIDTVHIALFPTIKGAVSQSARICKNKNVHLEATGGVHYLWDNGDTTAATMVSLSSSGYVHVRIENVCVDYDSVLVSVMNDESVGGLYIPNAFTPNDDGINDYFEVKGQYIASLKAMIFDRWGAEIHKWEGVTGSWDGRMNGNLVQNDVYVYRIIASTECGEKEVYNGIVTVIK